MLARESLRRPNMNAERVVSHDRIAVDLSLLIVRVIAGICFMVHGAQKLFGVFDGMGLQAVTQPPPNGLGLLGYPVTIGEFFGGLGLVVGFLSRFSAASLIVIMVGAIAMVHGKNGYLEQNDGFEYNLALIGLLAPVFLCGPGRFTLGRLFLPKSSRTGRPVMFLE
jgi:putative oxidoreductase